MTHEGRITVSMKIPRFREHKLTRNATDALAPVVHFAISDERCPSNVNEKCTKNVDREIYSRYLPHPTYLILPPYLSLLPSLS